MSLLPAELPCRSGSAKAGRLKEFVERRRGQLKYPVRGSVVHVDRSVQDRARRRKHDVGHGTMQLPLLLGFEDRLKRPIDDDARVLEVEKTDFQAVM